MGNSESTPKWKQAMENSLKAREVYDRERQRQQERHTAREYAPEDSKEHSMYCLLPFLYMGDHLVERDLNLLKKNHIGYVLEINEHAPAAGVLESYEKCGIEYRRIDVADSEMANIILEFEACFGLIQKAKREAHDGSSVSPNILVVSGEGHSRSSTVVIAFLVENGWSLFGAIEYVKKNVPGIFPNKSFFGQLIEFEGLKRSSPSMSADQYPGCFQH